MVDKNCLPPTSGQEATPLVEEEQEEHVVACNDDMDLDVEGPQRLSDTSNPKSIDEPMHDAHVEIGLEQGPNP